MFVIFGTKITQKILGYEKKIRCGRCNNVTPWQIVKVTNWFSLFFIPIFPLSTKYYEICPICHGATPITKSEAEALIVNEVE
ncbi:zinc-ribbon domain-containing protein [Anaerorhabdus sp.]|jgi:hypothetical protein|uniref:zinc-ribbon domain-containing protein n=1 Tax=Anaerorhabdus sp. TaxID=1872524 RepID=UPI002FC83156